VTDIAMIDADRQRADAWIAESELRRRLAYSRSTVTRLRKQGLPHVGRDRLRRYEWQAVLEWLSRRA
jgi:hypothetical protein